MLDQSEAREMQAASVCVALQFCCVLLQREVEREAGRRGEERRGEDFNEKQNIYWNSKFRPKIGIRKLT